MNQKDCAAAVIRAKRRKRIDNIQNLLISIWPLVGFFLFGMIPMALSLYMSFTELHSSDLSEAVFVGLSNFKRVLTWKGYVWYAYLNTLLFMITVPVTIGVSLYVANLVTNVKSGQRFFRSILFIPYICSSVVVAFAFRMLYSETGGILNSILDSIGFAPVRWLTKSPVMFMVSVDIMAIWSGSGSCIVLLSAALSRVDESYYEAAKIDGITPRKMFWKITLPAVTPTLSYLATMNVIGALQVMEGPQILGGEVTYLIPWWKTAGGENICAANHTVVLSIYNMSFTQSFDFGLGMGSASAWVLAIIILAITQLNRKLQEKWVCYDF